MIVVQQSTASAVGFQRATLNGTLFAVGAHNPTITFCWGETDGGTTLASWTHRQNIGPRGIGTLALVVAPEPGRWYWWRIFAESIEDGESAWSDVTFLALSEHTFSTPSLQPGTDAAAGSPSQSEYWPRNGTVTASIYGGEETYAETASRDGFTARLVSTSPPIQWVMSETEIGCIVQASYTSSADGNGNHDVRTIGWRMNGLPYVWNPSNVTSFFRDVQIGLAPAVGVTTTPAAVSDSNPTTAWALRKGFYDVEISGYLNPEVYTGPIPLRAYATPRRLNYRYNRLRSMFLDSTVGVGAFTFPKQQIHLRASDIWTVSVGYGLPAVGYPPSTLLWSIQASTTRRLRI